MHETRQQAHATARSLVQLFDEDRAPIEWLGRTANTGLRLHEHLMRHTYTSVRGAADALARADPTVRDRIEDVERLGIVAEATGQARDRIWSYQHCMSLLPEGTEPL